VRARHGRHIGHKVRGRHHIRNRGVRARHSYRHYGNRRYRNSGFLAGIMTGYIGHGLTHRYRAPAYYPGYYGRVAPAQVTVIREVNTAAPSRQAETFGTCLQQREYQTLVTVGGRNVEAYGTACLQADGSWLRGPVKLPPEF
jgi:hypothetical protein